jgi:predicted nucleic acid-binding protein
MTRQGSVLLTPVAGSVLTESWRILLEEHIYAADALQISSCKHAECDLFVSADRALLERARAQGLTALDPENDERKLSSV